MSENILQKIAGLAGRAFAKETPDPYQTPIDDFAVATQPVMRPQAIGSAELVFGDVPHVPPDFKP